MSDLQIIEQIEKEIKIPIKSISAGSLGWGRNGYVLDSGKVIGIYLSVLGLDEIPPSIFKLSNLEELELFENKITIIPEKISEFKNLTGLGLSCNKIKIIPKSISTLTKLRKLSLHDNRIEEIPIEILDLKINFGRDRYNQGLILDNNPLKSPPLEIYYKGTDAVRSYFKSLQGDLHPLNEVKIMLVGEGASGKTSLSRILLGEKFNENESTTHGIRIKDWKIVLGRKKIKVNIWDFGGQEVMHATHQFFLSKRSLYILVLDGRRDERPEYWLQQIESLGGDSPVLVVLNKYDTNPGYDLNRPFLQKKYKGIRKFFRTSCATGHGIDEFRQALSEELSEIKMIETRWSNDWFKVKQDLERIDKNFISYEKYEKICAKRGLTETLSQDVLIEFLHDIGVVVHFKDFDLNDTHVLNPRWITTAVYRIINSQKVARDDGTLKLEDLKEILKERNRDDYSYPRHKHRYIIELMEKFELCYNLNDKTVLIPQLLRVAEPDFDFDFKKSLQFLLDYDTFLPLSIMPRFIFKRHKDIKNQTCWRTGVLLENKKFQSTAVITSDNEANKLYIYVNGQQPKDYLAVILMFFREINASFEKLKVSERIPMPDNPKVSVSYKTLLNHAREGMPKIIPDDSDKAYDVNELLGLVQINSEQRILDILLRIEDKITDEDSLIEHANKIFTVNPNFMGIGVNWNKIVDLYRSRKKGK